MLMSWIKRLHAKKLHNWIVITLHMITKKLGEKFSFHSNLDLNPKQLYHFPQY